MRRTPYKKAWNTGSLREATRRVRREPGIPKNSAALLLAVQGLRDQEATRSDGNEDVRDCKPFGYTGAGAGQGALIDSCIRRALRAVTSRGICGRRGATCVVGRRASGGHKRVERITLLSNRGRSRDREHAHGSEQQSKSFRGPCVRQRTSPCTTVSIR
jgi:hypothetical protein